MPGKPLADPLPATTYAGFAASAPGRLSVDPRAPHGIVRTYARSELQLDSPDPGRSPLVAGAALATTFALGAVLGFVLVHRPEPVSPRPEPAPAALVTGTERPLPPAPLAMAVTEPAATTPPAPPRPTPPRPPKARPASRDPQFAALDEQLNKAYADAIRAGAAAGPLSEQQESWIIRRDRIRHQDPEMAADLYRSRIAELQALATQPSEPAPTAP